MQIEVTPKKGAIAGSIGLVLVLALLGTGYFVGRYKTPPAVVVQEKVRVEQVEKQVVVTQTVTKTELQVVKASDRDNNIHRTYIIEEKPDGTKTTHITEDDKSEVNVNSTTTKNATVTSNTRAETTKETVRTEDKVVTPVVVRPKWKGAALVGYNVPGLWGEHSSNILPNDVVVGGLIERRLVGPLSFGVWGTSTKVVGASLSVEW